MSEHTHDFFFFLKEDQNPINTGDENFTEVNAIHALRGSNSYDAATSDWEGLLQIKDVSTNQPKLEIAPGLNSSSGTYRLLWVVKDATGNHVGHRSWEIVIAEPCEFVWIDKTQFFDECGIGSIQEFTTDQLTQVAAGEVKFPLFPCGVVKYNLKS